MSMSIRKYGEGKVLPGEDAPQKTASEDTPEQREQRQAALDKENAEADE